MARFSLRGGLDKHHNISITKKCLKLQTKTRKNGMKSMQDRFKRLKTEMEQISEEQKGMKEQISEEQKRLEQKGMEQISEEQKGMDQISEEQKGIREGQRRVREKFEAIESECEQLKKETMFIIRQSAGTRIKFSCSQY